MFIFRSILLRTRNFSESFVGNIKTEILYSITLFIFENPAVYKGMSKNIVDLGRPHMKIRRMRIACWIPDVKDTHSEYVIIIVVPLQRRFPAPPYFDLRTLPISVHETIDEAIQFISADVKLHGNKYY
jgi:hypothetical protein